MQGPEEGWPGRDQAAHASMAGFRKEKLRTVPERVTRRVRQERDQGSRLETEGR